MLGIDILRSDFGRSCWVAQSLAQLDLLWVEYIFILAGALYGRNGIFRAAASIQKKRKRGPSAVHGIKIVKDVVSLR